MTQPPPSEPAQSPGGPTTPGAQPTAASSGVDYPPAGSGQGLAERPEVKVAATFVGGLLAATILKRLAR